MQRSRFGELAVAAGYLTEEQLRQAEALQEQDTRAGRVPRPLGILAMQLGLMTFQQVSATLERARRKGVNPQPLRRAHAGGPRRAGRHGLVSVS